MVLHSALFTGIRVLEIIVALPVVGILGWFVNPYVKRHQQIPDNILTMFIVSILASAWAIVTLWQFKKFRAVTGPVIAALDLAFVGAWIASVVLLRGISNADCGNLRVPLGITIGDRNYSGGSNWGLNVSKPCALMKAAWILSIVECVLFFITCVLSWTLYRAYKTGTHTVHHKDSRRSGSTSTYSSHRHRQSRHSHV